MYSILIQKQNVSVKHNKYNLCKINFSAAIFLVIKKWLFRAKLILFNIFSPIMERQLPFVISNEN